MPHNQRSFVIPDNQRVSALVSLLQNSFPVHVLAETVNNRVFYDTFDWRLYKNGSVLEVHEGGQSSRIYWRADKDGKLKIQLGLRKIPRLAGDLPACELRQQLQSVISVRELLPRIKIRIKRQSLTVLDENKKVVVRLNFDVYRHRPSRLRAARVLTKRLTIKAVKGYAKDYQKVEAFTLGMQLQPAQDNLMKLALIASGVSTGEYTTKLSFLPDLDMPAEQVLKKILLRLLEIMRQNTSGSINGRDTEFMHDYRDSIRKTRTALKLLNDVLLQAVNTKYTKFFSMLDKLTSPVRDLDVFLLQLERYQGNLDKSARQQLQPLREYLLHSRAELQKKFIEIVKSPQSRENIKQWRDYLERPGMESSPPDNPGKVAYKLADELIWDVYQQTREQDNAIADNSKAETLYELRKTFTKQDYLIEFFRSLYPAGKIRLLIQLLTDLQDDLEKINDLNIHISIVKEFIKQSINEGAINACEQMIKFLQQQQNEAGKSLKDHYAVYSSSANHKKFREMFVDYHGGS